MPAQPPGRVGPYDLVRAVGQQDPHRLGERVPQRRPGQQGQGLRPLVVVHEVQVPYGDQLGGDRRYRRVREPVEDVLAPDVHGVEETRVVGLGEVAFPGLQFVGVQHHVRGPHEGEVGQHTARGQRLLAPSVGQLGVHRREFAFPDDLMEGAAGEDEFTGGRGLPVLVRERERAEPGLVPGIQRRVPHQCEDGVGQLLRVGRVLLPVQPPSSSREAATAARTCGVVRTARGVAGSAPSFSSRGCVASGWATFSPSRASTSGSVFVASGEGSNTWRGPMVVRPSASGTGSPDSRSGSTPARLS